MKQQSVRSGGVGRKEHKWKVRHPSSVQGTIIEPTGDTIPKVRGVVSMALAEQRQGPIHGSGRTHNFAS